MNGHAPWASWYARLIRVRHVAPGPVTSFLLFDCVLIAAAVLAFADAIRWWAVLAAPLVVAAAVKCADAWVALARRSAMRVIAPAGLPRQGAQLVGQFRGGARYGLVVRAGRTHRLLVPTTHQTPPGPRARTAPDDVRSVTERASDPFLG